MHACLPTCACAASDPTSVRLLLPAIFRYENLALDLLDSIRESTDAVPLISLIEWVYVDSERGGAKRRLLWDSSPLESAAEEDGLLSMPCRRFIAHRHSQFLIDAHFHGDYPGSFAQIPNGSSLLLIVIQAFLPFLPGTVVEVSPTNKDNHVARSGPSVKKDRKRDEGVGGRALDPDLIDAVEALNPNKDLIELMGIADLISDLTSYRFLYFYGEDDIGHPKL